MLNRRRFLKSILAASTISTSAFGSSAKRLQRLTLQADPARLIDIPEGFRYDIVSRRGSPMNDGLSVPGAHDGMAAFPGDNGRVILVCNHELTPLSDLAGPFERQLQKLPESKKSQLYDRGGNKTPGAGGTTTTIYNPATRETEYQFLSLGGTDTNCAGGKTPWNSWLSCEESFSARGSGSPSRGLEIIRDCDHGYVFEVPASARELVKAVPLRDMGRFEHEAAAVHDKSGVVYLTEDQWDSLFYRFLPNVPGELHRGGRLQALAIQDRPSAPTQNWQRQEISIGETLQTRWIDLHDVDSSRNDLRHRGATDGAATFARAEGLAVAGDGFAFTCTTGGPDRVGQIFTYKPSPFEGAPREQDAPGELTLIAEATPDSMLHNCDNLTMAPWGDLIVCEDTDDSTDHCALIAVRPDGHQYMIANNAYSDSELAGVCFSPDGRTLFVNIQYPGMTVAITGPWPQ